MKLFITIIVLFSINYVFSQQQIHNKIIQAVKYSEKKNGNIEFILDKNFIYRYTPLKNKKKYVSFDSIKSSLITFSLLSKNISVKKTKDSYIKLYKGKQYNLWFYISDPRRKNEGFLYEVNRMVPFYDEID